MIHKARGIVLHHIKYKETSAVVYIYTDLFGRQSYLVNSIKGKRSKYSSNLLQPLTLLEMEVYHKEGRELQRIKEVRNHIPYRSIPFNPYKRSQTLFLAEVLYRSLREEDPTPGLMDFLEKSLQILDISEENTLNFHLFFIVQLTKFLGFYPRDNFTSEKNGFDMRNGQFADSFNLHPDFFDTQCSQLLYKLLGTTFGEISELAIDQDIRTNFLDYMMDFFRLHLMGFGKVKSLSVLHDVFRD
jgi:DNA repair protein RecO (recombination protein O)